jgi:hypothetical protein
VQTGISGPVNVVGRERLDELAQKLGGDQKYIIQEVTKELAFNKWTYKIGLRGERQQLHDPMLSHKWRWFGNNLPTNKMFVWYKVLYHLLLLLVFSLMGAQDAIHVFLFASITHDTNQSRHFISIILTCLSGFRQHLRRQ